MNLVFLPVGVNLSVSIPSIFYLLGRSPSQLAEDTKSSSLLLNPGSMKPSRVQSSTPSVPLPGSPFPTMDKSVTSWEANAAILVGRPAVISKPKLTIP